jgi:hypothetical protein
VTAACLLRVALSFSCLLFSVSRDCCLSCYSLISSLLLSLTPLQPVLLHTSPHRRLWAPPTAPATTLPGPSATAPWPLPA